jgi:Tol biopolymer transport system component
MIMKISRITTVGLVLALVVCSPTMAQTGHDLYQQALVKEQAEGDLRSAIALYQRIVEEFASDRALAARALVQMGQCHERLGSREARSAYRQVLEEYADQAESVEQARARLTALEQPEEQPGLKALGTQQIWAGLDANAHDLTPDGRHIVVNASTGALALREVSTGETRQIIHGERGGGYGGRVSPDGKWVAHGYSGHGEAGALRIVGLDGQNLRVLLEEPGCWIQPYGWTSDGQQIAGRWDCWRESNPEGTHQVVLVSVDGGGTRVLHEVPGTRHGFRAWISPDDRYLVYGGPVEEDEGNDDIWLLSLDGGDPRPLIRHPADDRILGWVPGTDFVVFLSNRDGTWDLWAASVEDGALQGQPLKIWRDMGQVDPAGFSRDGSFVYSVFTRWFNTSIASIDPATGMVDPGAAKPLLGSNRGARWSPDGRSIAFVTESDLTEGKFGRITVRDLESSEQREVASWLRARRMFGWSPDGKSVLLAGDDGRDHLHWWKVDVSSGEGTPLLPIPNADHWWRGWTWAEWSPDGGALIYSMLNEDDGQGRLVRRDLDSGEEEELYRESLLIRRPFELSPDRSKVAFVFMDSVNAEMPGGIATLDLDTRVPRKLVTFGDSLGEWEVCLQWAADGEALLYSEILGGEETGDWRTRVSRISAAGGEPEALWTLGEGKWGGWFDLSPDGRQIALTTYTQEEQVWLMENLLEALEDAAWKRDTRAGRER